MSIVVIAIAERVYNPSLPDRVVKRAARGWNPLNPGAPGLRAFAGNGSSARRWHELLGGAVVDHVINLLPPDNKPGTWSIPLATFNAGLVLGWSQAQGFRVVLLGRRVARAFRCDLPFGRRHGNILVLPHPSGRSRVINDHAERRRLRRALRRFCLGE